MKKTRFDYFYGNETQDFPALQIPFILFKHPKFKDLSSGAKILYGLLLNKTSLSSENNWIDDDGIAYIVYTIKDIMEDLNCYEQKASKAMKELRDIGLVKIVKQGLNKPNLIYVTNLIE